MKEAPAKWTRHSLAGGVPCINPVTIDSDVIAPYSSSLSGSLNLRLVLPVTSSVCLCLSHCHSVGSRAATRSALDSKRGQRETESRWKVVFCVSQQRHRIKRHRRGRQGAVWRPKRRRRQSCRKQNTARHLQWSEDSKLYNRTMEKGLNQAYRTDLFGVLTNTDVVLPHDRCVGSDFKHVACRPCSPVCSEFLTNSHNLSLKSCAQLKPDWKNTARKTLLNTATAFFLWYCYCICTFMWL